MERTVKTKFYEYRQNNSGGFFDDSMPAYLFIEAMSANHANMRAMDLGVYFDGASTGQDCSCCGDRWHEAFEEDSYSTTTQLNLRLSELGYPREDQEHPYYRVVPLADA